MNQFVVKLLPYCSSEMKSYLYYNIKNIKDELKACFSPARLSSLVQCIIYSTSYVHSCKCFACKLQLCDFMSSNCGFISHMSV